MQTAVCRSHPPCPPFLTPVKWSVQTLTNLYPTEGHSCEPECRQCKHSTAGFIEEWWHKGPRGVKAGTGQNQVIGQGMLQILKGAQAIRLKSRAATKVRGRWWSQLIKTRGETAKKNGSRWKTVNQTAWRDANHLSCFSILQNCTCNYKDGSFV